ncbi:ATP-binding cassette domain-containing protein [Pseudogracilibacillus sp. SO30301A]|uniref:ATP-binding cassette domain-containing protein n=1 Tax=Pseudogracilibacillus sp. SO30301A TaxID=3098291 RepID=UPI00300DCFB7
MFEQPLLQVKNVTKKYGAGCQKCAALHSEVMIKNYCPVCRTVYACRDVSFDLYSGEILGIVGESGSGKSTLMQCLYFDLETSSGEVYMESSEWQGENLFYLSAKQKRSIRNSKFGMVYQNPIHGLKMEYSAISNIGEKLIAAGNRNVKEMESIGNTLFREVEIPLFRSKEKPLHFSGGMQQRVQIAKALSNNPPILFLDEITTGLDLSVQANVLDVIKNIQVEYGVSMIVVSHDLAVIRMLADRTLVMLDGQVIEKGLTDQILEDPQHHFTQQLVYSLI